MDKKVKNKKTLKILVTLFVILLCGLFVSMLFMNNEISRLDNEKNNILVIQNNVARLVQSEIINYLNVTNKETWNKARQSANLSETAVYNIYGEDFKTFSLSNVTEYKILDILYDINDNVNIVFSVDTFLKVENETINRNFIVTYNKEKSVIDSIEVY